MSIEVLSISVAFSILVAYFLGRKRQIGFAWSLFIGLLLSPLISIIATFLSRKIDDPNPEPSKTTRVWAIVLIVLASLSFLNQMMDSSLSLDSEIKIQSLVMSVGIFVLGYYLLELSKGRRFNDRTS